MNGIDPAQAAAYLKRWRTVAARERVELRATPLEQKFRQLSALFASRALFPADSRLELEVEEVRERWARIRAAHRA